MKSTKIIKIVATILNDKHMNNYRSEFTVTDMLFCDMDNMKLSATEYHNKVLNAMKVSKDYTMLTIDLFTVTRESYNYPKVLAGYRILKSSYDIQDSEFNLSSNHYSFTETTKKDAANKLRETIYNFIALANSEYQLTQRKEETIAG
jgi:hypothetical protein